MNRGVVVAGLVALCTLLGARPLGALDYIGVGGSVVYLGNTQADSGPSPILQSLGVEAPITQGKWYFLEGGVRLFGLRYQYVASQGRPVPTEIEYADYLDMLGV